MSPRPGSDPRLGNHPLKQDRLLLVLELDIESDARKPRHGNFGRGRAHERAAAAAPCATDAARAIAAKAQVFVTLESRDPTLATMVHDIRNYAAEDIRFGMRCTDAMTTAEDGTPVLDLTRIGALATVRNRAGRSAKKRRHRPRESEGL
jgi:hypothetical protein